ncbi:MAG: RHS repeat-associated core domain-containing protein, partial [Isosphaerales bacterium]
MSLSRSRASRAPSSLRKHRNHRQRRAIPFLLEPLEARCLLSMNTWTGKGNDNLWSDSQNWSNGVPGSSDDVNIPGGFPTIEYSSAAGATTIDSLTDANALDFSGGSLTVSSSTPLTSTISGALSFDGGALTVTGTNTSLTASGLITDSSGSMSALAGATLSLPGLTNNGYFMAFDADGAGSEIDLSNLTNFSGYGDTITQTGGATVLLNSGVTSVYGVTFTVDGTGNLTLLDQITSLTGGGLNVVGGTYTLGNLTDVDGSNIQVTDGAGLVLSGMATVNGSFTQFSADGGSSSLDISSISSFSGLYNTISDTNGATLKINSGFTSLDGVTFTVDGTGSFVPGSSDPLSKLTSLTDGGINDKGGTYSSLSNLTTVDGSSLTVQGGGKLVLSGVLSFNTGIDYGVSASFTASGTGSLLSLPNLATLSAINYYGSLSISATGGGDVELPLLASIGTANFYAAVSAAADGSGSVLDLPDLTTYSTDNGTLAATNSGTVTLNPSLTSLTGVTLMLDGTGTIPESQFTSINNGGVMDDGGVYSSAADFSKLTSIDGSSLTVQGGGKLVLSGVLSFNTGDQYGVSASFTASGTGSLLSLPNLATLSAINYYGGLSISATGQGDVELPVLTSINTANFYAAVSATADGSGSLLDLPNLTAYSTYNGTLAATNSGTVTLNPSLTSLTGVTLMLDGTGTIPESQFTAINNGGVKDEGGAYSSAADFSKLTNISGSSLAVQGGGKLVLAGVLSFDPSSQNTDFTASGAGSLLSLPKLASIGSTDFYGDLSIQASAGGDVELPALVTISTPDYTPVSASADGAGSVINLSSLTTFEVNSGGGLSATNGGTIELSSGLTSVSGVTITTDSLTGLPLDQFTSVTAGGITVEGVSYTLSNLTDIDGSSLIVENGGSLTLPANAPNPVTTYTNNSYGTAVFEATGGSTLSLAGLQSVSGSYGPDVEAMGTGSVVDISGLGSWSTTSGGGDLTATGGGTIALDSSLTSVNGVAVTLDGASTMDLSHLQTLTGGSITVNGGGPYDLASLTTIDGTALYAEGGATLMLEGVTNYANDSYYYGVPFQATGGSTLDLSQLQSISAGSYGLNVFATGANSVVDLSSLSSWSVPDGTSSLNATGGGTIALDSSLTGLNNVSITVDSPTALPFPSGFTSLTDSTMTVQGAGTYDLSALSDIDGSSFYAEAGAVVTLTGALSYTNDTYNFPTLEASGGGTLDLSQLQTIGGTYGVNIVATGAGSLVNLSSLTSIDTTYGGSLSATNGGTIELSGLTSLNGVSITVDSAAGGALLDQLTAFTNGTLTVNGTSLDLTSLSDIDGSSFYVENGGTLQLPAVQSYANNVNYNGAVFEATGGSTLDLSSLQSISGEYGVTASATDTASVVDLSGVTSWSLTYNYSSTLTATGGGTIDLSSGLTSLNDFNINVDSATALSAQVGGVATPALSLFGSLTDSTLTLDGGGAYSLSSLTVLDGSSLYAENGASLTIDLSSYSTSSTYSTYNTPTFEASGGGTLDFPSLQAISGYYSVNLIAIGQNSVVDLSALSSYTSTYAYNNSVSATGGGTIDLNAGLTSLSGVDITVDGQSSLPLGQLTSLTDSTVNVLGGTQTFLSLIDFDGSTLNAQDGANVTLPVATYTNSSIYYGTTLGVAGGSTLDLSNLTSIGGFYGVAVTAAGSGSEVELPLIATFGGGGGSLIATGGGTIQLGSGLTSLTNVAVTVDGQSTLDLEYLQTLTGGSITVDGATYTLPGLTAISGSSLYVANGGSLTLTGLITDTSTTSYVASFEATGTNSLLDLSSLTTISGGTLTVVASGSGAVINLLGLTTFSDSGSFSATNGGKIELGSGLTSLNGVTLTISSSAGAALLGQLTSFTNGSLTVDGATVTAPNLTDIDGSSIYVQNGGSLTLAGVTTYSDSTNYDNRYLEATGAGSILSLPKLGAITWTGYDQLLTIQATSGGQVDLPALTSMTTTGGYSEFTIDANGTGSLIDLSALGTATAYTGYSTYYHSNLTATGGSTIELGSGLTALTVWDVTVDSTSALTVGSTSSSWLAQLASLTTGAITILGGSFTLSSLSDIDGTSLYVKQGGNLDVNSTKLTTDTVSSGITIYLDAEAGSTLSLAGLTTLTGGYLNITASGANSLIDLSNVTTLTTTNTGLLSATTGGAIDLSASLTSLNLFSLVVDATTSLPLAQFTTLTNGGLTIEGGSFNLPNLTDLDGSNLTAASSGVLVLPDLASYHGSSYFYAHNTFEATGSLSKISLPILTTVITPDQYYGLSIEAYAAGHVAIPMLATVDNSVNPAEVGLDAEGALSQIDASSLTTLKNYGLDYYPGLEVTSGATLLDPVLKTLDKVIVSVDGSSSFSYAQWTSLTSSSFTSTGGTFNFAPAATSLSDIDGTSFYLYGGAVVSLPGVVSLADPAGIVVDLETSGSGSTLALPNLASLGTIQNYLYVDAFSGGHTRLPALATISKASSPYVRFYAQGAGSLIDVASLASYTASPGYGVLSDTQGATINDPVLTNLDGVVVTVDGSAIFTALWTNLTNGSFTATGGTYTFNLLTDFDASSVYVSGGAVVTFTAFPSYNGGSSTIYFQASGAGSMLEFPELLSLNAPTVFLDVQALSGGQVQLPLLAVIPATSPYVQFDSEGAGSTINVPALTSFTGEGGNAGITLKSGGRLLDPNLNSITDVNLNIDTSFTLAANESYTITKGATIKITASPLVEQGSLSLPDNATLNLTGGLEVDGLGVLALASSATFEISGNLVGNTTDADPFAPLGTVVFDSGQGINHPPQQLQAMSTDMGAVQAAYTNNFAYGTISLASNTYLQLIPAGPGTKAVYANELIVPDGATLDLNGLNLYARGSEIGSQATIFNGTITLIPGGGPIPKNAATPADLANPGEQDDWTFFGRAGETVTIAVDPGASGVLAAAPPQLGWVTVNLLDSHGFVLASATNAGASDGSAVAITDFTFPSDGTYTMQVEAPPQSQVPKPTVSQSDSTGNYQMEVFDVTPAVNPLVLGQQESGTVDGPFGVADWTFSGTASELVGLSKASADPGIVFNLTGPGSYSLTNLTQGQQITLPASGNYALTVDGTGSNGVNYTFELDQLTIDPLTLNAVPLPEKSTGSGYGQLFEVTLTSLNAQTLFVGLTDSTSSDVNQLYAKYGSAPTQSSFGTSYSGPSTADPSILISSAAPGNWYFLVYSASAPAASNYTIVATGAPVQLSAVTPSYSAGGSAASLTLTGAGFDQATSVSLVYTDPSTKVTTTVAATSVTVNTFNQITASFATLPASLEGDTVSIEATQAGLKPAVLPGSFTITIPGAAHLETKLIMPSVMGRHIAAIIYIDYSNTGSEAMPAPLLILDTTTEASGINIPLMTLNPALQVSGYWTSSVPAGYSTSIEVLASGKVPGMLEPGESVKVPVYYAGMLRSSWDFSPPGNKFDFRLQVFPAGDKTESNLSSLKSSLQPSGISSAAWSAIFADMVSQIGPTWGDYITMLDDEASYLGNLGENVTDVSQLWQFAIMQANGLSPVPILSDATDISVPSAGLALDFSRQFANSIISRDTAGPLGSGWTDNWQYSLAVGSDGTITVTMPSGQQRIFQPDSRYVDVYFSQPGDAGKLTAIPSSTQGGAPSFVLQEADGTEEFFNSNGTLGYIEDTQGNRITAGFTGSRLTSLTSSSGGSLTIGYSSSGRIDSVTGSTGQTIIYGYDSSNTYLVSVTAPGGEVTRYTYDDGTNAATKNALTVIANSDGSHQFFTYAANGRLATTSQDGGVGRLSFSYTEGEVTVTDSAGHASQYDYDNKGNLLKYVDPLGNASYATYNSNGNLTSITGPTGLTETFTYDAKGNVSSATDPLGETTTFTYTSSDNLLASVTNPQGDTTAYHYDPQGDLTAVHYPDNSVETATYDALGDPLSLTDQNGQATSYSYNAAGQVAGVTLADGTTMSYSFDTQGNLITATDSSGVTTLTYNAADQLTGITYPTGLSLRYTYNSGGQRAKLVEMSGTTVTQTVNYHYNSAGELAGLTDGTGAAIITYSYNNLGQLVKETFANGTSTTYQYDAGGNLLDLVNYAPGGSTVDSSFGYTYNTLGQATRMVTVDGTWTYTYDTVGQLIGAVFAPKSTSTIPAQSLSYTYDTAGDLTQTVVNGVAYTYNSNPDNQYTTVTSAAGTTTYTYNANGALVSESDASGTTTDAYNSLNQLVSVTSPTGSWQYEYDALGDLVSTIQNGQVTDNLVDPTGLGNVVGQYQQGSGGALSLLANYTYGLGLVSQSPSGGGTNSYAFDGLGSTVGLTNAAGAAVSSFSYLPYGGVLASTGTSTNSAGGPSNPFTFVGQFGVASNGSGLDAMGARSYDPAIGQFTTQDPLGASAGESNLYEYAGNSPTNAIDPTGTTAQFFGVSGSVLLSGSLGLSSSDNGAGELLSGLGGAGGFSAGSLNPSDASQGTTLAFGGTVAGSYFGLTAANNVGLGGGIAG